MNQIFRKRLGMIIGRKREQDLLERAFKAKKNQFITIYGRRRIGKTYLISEFFKTKDCQFLHLTGLHHGTMQEQLENFADKISEMLFGGLQVKTPKNWKEAFNLLTKKIESSEEKIVLFFDELPWMATPRSGLLNVIDYHWNNSWYNNRNIIFIACGSSASWILKNIIYNKGGLHNRTNIEINLSPFNLHETQEYLRYQKVSLNEKQILSLYMAIGGVPYYLDYVMPGTSAHETIQELFFSKNAPLRGEYNKLFESLFNNADAYKELVETIAKRREGISSKELAKTLVHSTVGGLLTERLQKLSDSGFIEKYIPWKRERGAYYKVIDEYCLFYIYWVQNFSQTKYSHDHWLIESQRPTYYAWSGYAFEAVCSNHIHEIIRGLDIKNARFITSWRYLPKTKIEDGAQIDLVIVRGDDSITLCEIKYTENPFVVDKNFAIALSRKARVFQKQTQTKSQLFFAIISANGIKKTLYSEELISKVVTTKDLFKTY